MDQTRHLPDIPWEPQLAAIELALGGDAPLDPALAPFCEVLRSGFLLAAIERRLTELAAGDIRSEALTRTDTTIVVARPGLRVRARIPVHGGAAGARIAMLARHTLVGNNGRSPIVVERYRQPRPEPNDIFDRTRTLEHLPDVRLAPGEALALRAARDGFIIRAESEGAVALIADGPPAVPLRWHHDARTLLPVLAEPAHAEWSRLRELLRFAESVGDERLGYAACELLEHPSHFIRWAAARAAARLQPEAGRLAMQVLSEDVHPQVRAAARATISGTPS